MLVKKKFKITKTFEVSLEILYAESVGDKENVYNKSNIDFVNNVKNLDYNQLTNKQKVRLTSIIQNLRKCGYVK